ncbi:hypothetical protein [Streptomyces sp. NBC_00645]
MNAAAAVFSPLWAVTMGVNLLLGLHADYSLTEEVPVLVVNLAVPLGLAQTATSAPVARAWMR